MADLVPVLPYPNDAIKGEFCIIAHMTAKPGKADEIQKLLAGIRANSNDKTKEPDCLRYITVRGGGDESDKFTVIEKYTSREALAFHRTSEPYLAMRHSGLIGELSIGFYEEFQ